MKTFLLSFLLLSIVQFSSQAQITLDNAYDENISSVLLESAGSKYAKFDMNNFELNLYNLDHSIYKTITISNPTVNLYDTSVYNASRVIFSYYVKEGLFDTDSEIEFMTFYQAYDNQNNRARGVAIINEDGSILFKKDELTPAGLLDYTGKGIQAILKASDNTTKMILQKDVQGTPIIDSTFIYNLPGTLVCDPCGGITGTRSTERTNGIVLKQNIPNPSNSYTTIRYELPEETTDAVLKIYNTTGIELKSYQIDKTFNDLQISTQELPSGTYYYTIQTNKGQVSSKKMVVVK